MQLYIIRHGESTNNATMSIDPEDRVEDPPLTPTGEKQAEHVAQFLKDAMNLETLVRHRVGQESRDEHFPHKITHLYCSPMHRALKTARPIAKALGLQANVWKDIHESGGIFLEKDGIVNGFGGLTRAAILEEFEDYLLPDEITDAGWWNPEDGQEDITLCHARAIRVAAALRTRAGEAESQDDCVALVTHGMFIDSLLKALLNTLPGSRYFHWHYNTAITRLDILNDGVLLVRYINRVDHLPADLITT